MRRTGAVASDRWVGLIMASLFCMATAAAAQDGVLDVGYGLGMPAGTTTISVPGMINESARMQLSGSGQLWVASTFVRTEVGSSTAGIVRFNANGQLDTTFNAGVTPGYARLFLAGPNGASDFTGALGLALDSPTNPTAAFVLVQGSVNSGHAPAVPEGQVFFDLERPRPFTTGFGQYIAVTKVNADGSVDTSYGSFGHAYFAQGSIGARDIVRDPQGGTVVLTNADSSNAFYLTRIDANGVVDANFGQAGTARIAGASGSQVSAMSLVVDRQGRFVVAGTFSSASAPGDWEAMIYRALPNGQPDSSFGVGGMLLTEIDAGGDNADVLNHLAIDAQDRIVAVGGSHNGEAFVSALCTALRVSADGGAVQRFIVPNAIAAHCTALGVAVSGNGRVLLAARLQNPDPPVKSTVIALDSTTFTPDASFGSAGVGQSPEFVLDAFPMDIDVDLSQRPLMLGVTNDQGRRLYVARYALPDKLLSDSFE